MTICPTCEEPVETERTLNEDSVDSYTYAILGHESCDQPKLLRLVRQSLKQPRVVKEVNVVRAKINRNNRQRGSKAQTEWARIIHGRNVGVLGREDVDDGFRLWEVKARKMPAWIREAFIQVNKHQGDQLRYVAIKSAAPGKPAEWWVIQKADQFIDTNGLGLVEPGPKRLVRR